MKQQTTKQQKDQKSDQQMEEVSQEGAVSFLEMFRFAKKKDVGYIILGTLCSMLIGGSLPIFAYLWGSMTNAFQNADKMVQMAQTVFIQYTAFGVASIFAGWGMQYFWNIAGESQANQCRKAYIQSLMSQEIGWFQTQKSTSQIVSRFVADTMAFQLAIGQKASLVIYLISMFISGFIISITQGWELTLVILSFVPFFVLAFEIMERCHAEKASFQEKIFQSASGTAQEALNSIKIVKQFNGQEHQEKRFQKQISELKIKAFSFNAKLSFIQGLNMFCFLFIFTLAYWYGSECVQSTSNCPQKANNPYSGGTILTIFFSMIIPAMNMNQFAPSIKVIAQGRNAAARIFRIIDRVPLVRSPENSIKLEQFKGVFRFEGVNFSYPKDTTRAVLQDLNMCIDCKSAGIMGESGCGKSTILQLMMRFYDPDSGKVTLDGIDLRQLDLHWLRSLIGYVGQEPLLFSASIKENMLVGKNDASDEEITLALRGAEILDFVMGLSENVNTYVGAGGSQLSGGQKQRIAIARALLKNPQILLLDEATSALDRRNEKLIQDTLNKVITDRISITVAHRLKTIMNSDTIFVIEHGKIAKQGKIHELQLKGNTLAQLRQIETINQEEIMFPTSFKKAHNRPVERFAFQGSNLNKRERIQSSTILIDQLKQKSEPAKNEVSIYSRLFSHSSDDSGLLFLLIIGVICSILQGIIIPSMGIHGARIISFVLMYHSDPSYFSTQVKWSCLFMLITCAVGPVIKGLQFFTFLNIGTSVANSVRKKAYAKVLRLPVSWFQNQENHAEQVSVRLSADIYTIKNIIGTYYSHLCGAIGSAVFGILLAFYFEWRTALVSIGLIPLIGASAIMQFSFLSGYLVESKKQYEESAKIVAQTLTNFKTVLSFCYQRETVQKYASKLDELREAQHSKKLISGLLYGISFFVLFLVYGLIFYLSAIFIRDNNLTITNAFSAAFLVLFSGVVAGNNAKMMPDVSMLKVSCVKLFALIDEEDEDEIQRNKGSMLLDKEIKGNIEFKNVSFKYENREEQALRGLYFKVIEGDKVGLVGASGCGKSTVLKLLLGFYNCQEGEILVDGERIEDYDVHCLRRNLATVSQQPELFDESVEYNIVYNQHQADPKRVRKAAEKAKLIGHGEEAEDFFARKVGPRGSHLSGGQKQRVAVARAVLRNARVLLLDEATSALDKENELQVQACLDAAAEGKTSLSATHKLETLRNASLILVFKAGVVIESGTYQQLTKQMGHFHKLQTGEEN